jgi:hypothetical protein
MEAEFSTETTRLHIPEDRWLIHLWFILRRSQYLEYVFSIDMKVDEWEMI